MESQNHRIVGVGRDLCGSSSPTLLPKQAAQDLVQAGLEYLQRRRLHNLSGKPVPVLCHPQREEALPHVQTELPVPQFVPIAPCPVTGHHWKELGPILLTPFLPRSPDAPRRALRRERCCSLVLGLFLSRGGRMLTRLGFFLSLPYLCVGTLWMKT